MSVKQLKPVFISTQDALFAMFNANGMEHLLKKYGEDVPVKAIEDAYERASNWLCGGLAVCKQPEGVQ